MVDTVLESGAWPVNSLGEILSKRGVGNTTVVGYIPTDLVPTGTDNKVVIRHETDYLQGGWAFLQDGRYTEGSPKSILNGVKAKIDFSLTQLAYAAGAGLTLNYNEATDRFQPTKLNEVFLANIRMKVKPSNQSGHMDVLVESPTVVFNPIVAQTVVFNKQSGDEHFFSLVQPIFIGQDIIDNGLEVYVQTSGTDITMYDYSVFIQKTYLPL